MTPFVEHIWAVRAQMVDGALIDLLLFANEDRAIEYAADLDGNLPLGFDKVLVVPRRVIGAVVERRSERRAKFERKS